VRLTSENEVSEEVLQKGHWAFPTLRHARPDEAHPRGVDSSETEEGKVRRVDVRRCHMVDERGQGRNGGQGEREGSESGRRVRYVGREAFYEGGHDEYGMSDGR